MNAEFDCYIKDYRKNLDKSLALSGESSIYFAHYKAVKLKEWLSARAKKSQNILDFGCGDGIMTSFIAQQFPMAKVYGVDPSPDSIKEAAEKYSSITFKVNYDEKPDLDFNDGKFDIVFAAGVFHHIPFERHVGCAQEIFRVLKPDGCLVMFELNPFNPLTVRTFKLNPIDQNATMLKPAYAKNLFKKIVPRAAIENKFCCFYPRILKYLRWTERFMTKIPMGALYATIVQKKSK